MDSEATRTGPVSDFRISAIPAKGALGIALRVAGPLLDRLLGIRKLRLLYERKGLRGLGSRDFLVHFVEALRIKSDLGDGGETAIPASGPCVVIANHPLGGLEGIILAEILGRVRRDVKIIGNLMLSFVRELADYFILVNNMVSGRGRNVKSLAEAGRWLKGGHCLVVFPAGRVGLYRPDKGYVTDEPWDKIALSLAMTTGAPFTPVHIGASSSRLFSVLCRFIYPMKLLLLVREFMNSFGKKVSFRIGRPIRPERLAGMTRTAANAYLRMRVYLLADPTGALPRTLAAAIVPPGPCVLPIGFASSGKAYSDTSVALIAAALTPRPRAEFPVALHPEVEDYIASRGLGLGELAALIEDIEGEALGLPPGLAGLVARGAAFSSAFVSDRGPALRCIEASQPST